MHAITPLISDISKQGPVSICLFTAVKNLQITSLSAKLEELKLQRFSALAMTGSAGDIIIQMLYPDF